MDDPALGSVVRALRQRRGWRQFDLAQRSGVSATFIGLLEAGGLERLGLRRVRRVCAELGIRLSWDAGYRRAELAQLRDERHAALAERLSRDLQRLGWLVAAGISFNEYGERGRIDLLAYEPMRRILLVIEVKSVIADIQDLLGGLDVKRRLAERIARRMGWQVSYVVPVIAVAATTTNRRRIADHATLFGRFALRGQVARRWLRAPADAPSGLLLMRTVPNPSRAGVKRVRPRAASAASPRPSTNPSSRRTHTRAERG